MKRVKSFLWATALLAGLTWLATSPALADQPPAKMSVNEQILQILLQRNIVSQQQYQRLKKQVEEERRAQASQMQVVYKRAKGMALQTRDGASSVALTGRLQIDGNAFMGEHSGHSSLFVRRARLAALVKWHRYFSAFVEAEFGKGKAALNDGFLTIAFQPQWQLRLGQFKQPFSMEELHSDNWIWTIERSVANRLAPSRDVGAMLFGDIGKGNFYYFLSVYNGNGKNTAGDIDEAKDFGARLVWAPLRFTGKQLFRDFYIGAAAAYGVQHSEAADWWGGGKLTAQAGTTWFKVDPAVRQDGGRLRYGVELFWSVGPLAVMGELMRVGFDGLEVDSLDADGNVTSTTRRDLAIWGGYVTFSWLITGEHAGFQGGRPVAIKPKRDFGLGPGQGWGAWQLVFRYDFARADAAWRDLDYVDSAAYTSGVRGITLGLNWYLNDMVRGMLNYYNYRFDQDITAGSDILSGEQGLLARIQLIF